MPNPYTKTFADYYDVMSESRFKNIDQELEFFQFIFHTCANVKVTKILDVGCGTGRHSIPLIKSGYEVTGLDKSQNMLNTFRKKLEVVNLKANIIKKDMKNIDFAEEFHAIICMNSAFMYLLADKDILQTLKRFRNALEPGGVAIIDIMNFLNLMGRYKENLVEKHTKDGINMERAIKHSIEDVPAIWNHQEFGIVEDNGEIMTYHELHRFRMHNYNEMRRFLLDVGFSKIRCFGDFTARKEVKSNSTRLLFIAMLNTG
jgi:ubiquinone/menaquinone biosynthesis C-methylase UbiE